VRFRWPWMSRALHEEIVAGLKTQIGDLDLERKRLHDALYAAFGSERIFYPRTDEPAAVQTSGEDTDLDELATETELEYVHKYRPSELGARMTELMREARSGVFHRQATEAKVVSVPEARAQDTAPKAGPQRINGKAASKFDQAEQEVKEKHA
jgi:hypothetical protein